MALSINDAFAIGIYRITSPSGSIYIGQSWDIKIRWQSYRKPTGATDQRKLKNSFVKYGVGNHLFEIICQLPSDCTQEDLDRTEITYIETYRYAGFNMLNIHGGGKAGSNLSNETRERMRKAQLGRKRAPFTEEHRANMSNARKGWIPEKAIRAAALLKRGKPSKSKGMKLTPEQAKANKDRQNTDEIRRKKSEAMRKIWQLKRLKNKIL